MTSPHQRFPPRNGTFSNVKILFDTNVLLWHVFANRKLGRKTKRLLERVDSELWLSPITLWECLILERDGRVQLEPNALRWVRDILTSYDLREAPLNHEVALHSRIVLVENEDPADRFLAATAAVYDLTLVTGDEFLLKGSGYLVLPNE